MNSTLTYNLPLHRPSRRINRVALPAAYSRVGNGNQATAGPSLLGFPPLPLRPLPKPITNVILVNPRNRMNGSPSHEPQIRPPSTSDPDRCQSLIKPRSSVHIAAFNVRTLKQMGQQAALVRTLDTLTIDVCCVSETRIQDPTTVVELTAPDVTSHYRLRTSGSPESAAAGQGGVGIVLSSRAEASLTDWIPVSSRLCAVRLTTSVNLKHFNPFTNLKTALRRRKLVDVNISHCLINTNFTMTKTFIQRFWTDHEVRSQFRSNRTEEGRNPYVRGSWRFTQTCFGTHTAGDAGDY